MTSVPAAGRTCALLKIKERDTMLLGSMSLARWLSRFMQANPPCSSSTYFLFSVVLTPPHFLSLVLTPSHCFCSLPALPIYWSAWSQHRLTSYAASLLRCALSRNMSGGKFRTIFLCLGRSGSEKSWNFLKVYQVAANHAYANVVEA